MGWTARLPRHYQYPGKTCTGQGGRGVVSRLFVRDEEVVGVMVVCPACGKRYQGYDWEQDG